MVLLVSFSVVLLRCSWAACCREVIVGGEMLDISLAGFGTSSMRGECAY